MINLKLRCLYLKDTAWDIVKLFTTIICLQSVGPNLKNNPLSSYAISPIAPAPSVGEVGNKAYL